MKKNFILFSLFLCIAFLGSCHKDQDKTSNTGSSSNSNGPAEDPGAMPVSDSTSNGSQEPSDHTSAESQTDTSRRDANTLKKTNNSTNKKGEDSLTGTGVAGEQGSGSGVGNGGSINAAKEKKKK